ncbi:MAG: metal ABC transporter permease [Myxococcota bacterium]
MPDFIQTMFWPFVACLLLAGIHVYLGIHVLARQVVFVDLALAQVAALGSVVGILLGVAPKLSALVFAICGAILLVITKAKERHVSQEAYIGIFYAVALAATILASSGLPHGADELRELFSGNILWVEPETLGFAAILYAAIGLFHWVFRKQFFKASFEAGKLSYFWDFAFYCSFALVVTSSVEIAGVLLVFCYLVIPAVIATILVKNLAARLWVGWTVGALVSFVGVVISYYGDLPSGPTIVLCFAAFLLMALGVQTCRTKQMS